MHECEKVKSLLVLFVDGDVSHSERESVETHLRDCAACRSEAREIAGLVNFLADPVLFEPPADLRWQSLGGTLAARVRESGKSRGWLPLSLGRHGWAVCLGVIFLAAAAVITLMQRSFTPVALPHNPPGNVAFVERIGDAYAREAATRYLSECQDLLLELVRAAKPCDGETIDVSSEVIRARELLGRKRLLDAELDSAALIQARGLCDDLESFLVDLSVADRCETPGELGRMEQVIRSRQLLLRIHLVQSELS